MTDAVLSCCSISINQNFDSIRNGVDYYGDLTVT